MTQPHTRNRNEFAYHSERARSETLAALAAENPKVAAIHVELATRHVRACREDEEGGDDRLPSPSHGAGWD